jgi:hypothetical protein
MVTTAGTVPVVTVAPVNPDVATGQEEYTWQNMNWSKYWGYFTNIPELKQAVLMKALWVCGKGYTADPETTVILDHVSGWGKDNFRTVLFNLLVQTYLAGDGFAEIIRDKDSDIILNIKPLDPGSIKIVVDSKGVIIRYEQTSNIVGGVIKFKPEQILHFSNNRIGGECHGVSDITAMEKTILAEYESFDDTKTVMHRFAKPLIMFRLGTDDPTKINAFANKMDAAIAANHNNIYIPDDKNTVNYEVININVSELILAWRESITRKFYRALGLPLILFGSSTGTESASKIEYLAHEEIFSHNQLFVEDNIWNQLYLRIKLNSPVTLLDNLQTDQAKDASQGMEIQQSDVTAGRGA